MEIPIWRKWLNPYGYVIGRFHSRLINSMGRAFSNISMSLQRRLRQITQRPGKEVIQLLRPDDRYDILWNKLSPALGIACVRDQRNIAWRYYEKPGSPYSVRLLHDHSEPIGYAVTRIKDEDVRIGYIVDVLCRPDRETMKEVLMDTLMHMCLARVDLVKCLIIRGHPLAGMLEELGFRMESEGIKVLVQLFDDSIDRSFFFDARNWYITFGDLDGM
jgi:hypothetical protein